METHGTGAIAPDFFRMMMMTALSETADTLMTSYTRPLGLQDLSWTLWVDLKSSHLSIPILQGQVPPADEHRAEQIVKEYAATCGTGNVYSTGVGRVVASVTDLTIAELPARVWGVVTRRASGGAA